MAAGLGADEAWVVFAHCFNSRPEGVADAAAHAVLQPALAAIDPAALSAATRVVNLGLHSAPATAAPMSRAQRLQSAMRRSGA